MLSSCFHRVGGKSRLTPRLIPLMPEKFSVYVEPFVGAGHLFWALASRLHRYDVKIVLADADPIIYWTFRVIQSDDWGKLASQAWKHNTGLWRELKKRLTQYTEVPSEWNEIIDWIYCYHYVMFHSFLGHGDSPSLPHKSQSPPSLGPRLGLYHKLMHGVELHMSDYRALLWEYGRITNSFLYLDPPYFNTNTELYYKMLEPVRSRIDLVTPDEVRLACSNIKGKFLLSYDDAKEVRNSFNDFYINEIETTYSIRAAVRKVYNKQSSKRTNELLISNYPLLTQELLIA